MFPPSLEKVIAYFSHLPGVGKRTAERMALGLMGWEAQEVAGFGAALAELREKAVPCPVCGYLMEAGGDCPICSDSHRERSIICVVEQTPQIHNIEKSGSFNGLYHVLGGKLSPVSGIGPAQLRLEELKARIEPGVTQELLLAISPDVEGEATAHFLAEMFEGSCLAITRIAAGVPVGADLSFADTATLASAIAGRRNFSK